MISTSGAATKVASDLGYSEGYIKVPRGANGWSVVAAEHINRHCEGGCDRTLRFTPQTGVVRLIRCSVCKRTTQWRVVA